MSGPTQFSFAGKRKGVLNGPSKRKHALFGHGRADACTSAPLGQMKCDALYGIERVLSGIRPLLHRSCPPTIFRRIWSIVIFPVDRVRGRWLVSHVVNKKDQPGHAVYIPVPSITDMDAPAPIQPPILVGGLVATVVHFIPSAIKRVFAGYFHTVDINRSP